MAKDVKRAIMAAIIPAFETAMDAKYIGTLDGSPYFIDVSGCPFAHGEIMRYDPAEPDCFEVLWLDNAHGQLKQMALKAMLERDTKDAEYIKTIEMFGDKKELLA